MTDDHHNVSSKTLLLIVSREITGNVCIAREISARARLRIASEISAKNIRRACSSSQRKNVRVHE